MADLPRVTGGEKAQVFMLKKGGINITSASGARALATTKDAYYECSEDGTVKITFNDATTIEVASVQGQHHGIPEDATSILVLTGTFHFS